jgi:uncharacterized protein (DUF433 family)
MNLPLAAEVPPLRVNEHGVILVGKTRVPLDTVIWEFNHGATPEEIVMRFTTLALADVYSVIAYYLNHQSEIDEYLRSRRERAEQLRQEVESRYNEDVKGMRERLLARLKKQ